MTAPQDRPALYAHPFSSYCQKALIAFYELNVAFDYRSLDGDHPAAWEELAALWPVRKFPVMVDRGKAIVEATAIIEHLEVHHRGGTRLIPADPAAAVEVRMIDRIFDNHVMAPMQRIVSAHLAAPGAPDPIVVAAAEAALDTIYGWIDARLGAETWAAGDAFGLADCAAAPSLFYADWVRPIPDAHRALRAYRARLLARPSVALVVEEARPYRHLFPPGAPARRRAIERGCAARRACLSRQPVHREGRGMTTFDDRERAFEGRFARDEEMAFRITARRNRLVGAWAAKLMGLTPEETDAYAKAVVQADFEEAGDEDVIRKVLGDLVGAQVAMDEAQVRTALADCMVEARRQLLESQ